MKKIPERASGIISRLLAVFILLMVSFGANAGDDCSALYAQSGAMPGSPTCQLNVVSNTPGGLGNYACLNDLALIREWCTAPAADETEQSCPVADPVYPGSGAVTLTEADFMSGDDLPLYFTRTYRSKPLASNASAMGPAWFHSWQRHLDLTNANHSRTAKVLAYRENGEPITFNWNAGAWRTPGFTGLALTRNGSESGNANEAAWTLTNLQTDTTESYSAQGVLLTESTRTGFVRTLSYDSSGLLSTITQHAIGTDARKDITLRLDYDDKRRLSRLNDPLGRLTQSLSAYKGSGDFAVIVLNPDPFNYFHFHFGKHPGFIIEANRSDNDFFEILMKDPGDSPADVIGFYSEQYVVLPLSGEWFMYADRGWDWGTGVLITGPPDVMNVARQAFAFYENPG